MNEDQNRAEREYIEMEAARNDSSERYFNARPQFDTVDRRKVFESGFDRGWKAAIDKVLGEPVGVTGEMPGTSGSFTMAAFKSIDVPNNTKLYAPKGKQ